MIYVEPTIRNGWRAGAKRVFDIAIAIVALIVDDPGGRDRGDRQRSTSPVRCSSVRRVSVSDGRHFEIIKLRTMVVDAEARKADLMAQNESDGPLFKIRNDPRVTRDRSATCASCRLDELPQFWNVLRGEMSVVGPRPALPAEVEKWAGGRSTSGCGCCPGITGMWQVSGAPTRRSTSTSGSTCTTSTTGRSCTT